MDGSGILNEIIRLSTELNTVQDEDILLEKILFEARAILGADAGSIYVRHENSLVFNHVQNDTIQKSLPPGRRLPYTVYTVPLNTSSISGYVASTGEIVSIPDVYNIPETKPYHFDPFFDKVSQYRTKSMLTIPLKNNRGAVIGVLQIINARDASGQFVPFNKEDEPFILHFAGIASMILERAGMTRSMILRMISMAELRDPKETGVHVNRVASYAVELYERWATIKGKPRQEIDHCRDLLRMAAMLHDVGKVAISDLILKKPAALTPEERIVMQKHTWLGARLFEHQSSELDTMSEAVALYHHENWDGTGYPGRVNVETGQPLFPDAPEKNKIAGEDIPIWGRITALADVYDALSSKRVYKGAWDEKYVLDEISGLSGTKFDPLLVEIFFENIDNMRALRLRYPDTD
jgi:HD-GYP domain-containing protein (c-di-GMP phosphodiesterase class II)